MKNQMICIRISDDDLEIADVSKLSHYQIYQLGLETVIEKLPELIKQHQLKAEMTIEKYDVKKKSKRKTFDLLCEDFKKSHRNIDGLSSWDKNWVEARLQINKIPISVNDFVYQYKQWETRQEAMKT